MHAKPSFPVAAAAVFLCALCAGIPAFAQITAPPQPQVGTNVASAPVGQTAPAITTPHPVQTQTPFQVTVSININNFVYTNVTIPSGKRLVIQYVNLSGDTEPTSGTQPFALLYSTVNGTGVLYYFSPTQSSTASTQWYLGQSPTIYADTLAVGPAYAGDTPSVMDFGVTISGYLIDR